MRIAIDAGHGRYTAGKRCDKALDSTETREWWLNQRIASKVCTHLERCGAQTIRLDDVTGERDVPLSERSNRANTAKADYCVSIHHDSGANGTRAGGATVFVYSGKHSTASDRLQANIYQAFVQAVGKFGNRATPLNRANFHMVRETAMPAVLIECGFMDSETDTPLILTEEFAEDAAEGIAKGICATAGLSWVEPAADKPAAAPTVGSGDHPSPWAKPFTDWGRENGLFSGDGAGNFDWQAPVTREQLAAVLYQYHARFES